MVWIKTVIATCYTKSALFSGKAPPYAKEQHLKSDGVWRDEAKDKFVQGKENIGQQRKKRNTEGVDCAKNPAQTIGHRKIYRAS